jgi:hypothetical protein
VRVGIIRHVIGIGRADHSHRYCRVMRRCGVTIGRVNISTSIRLQQAAFASSSVVAALTPTVSTLQAATQGAAVSTGNLTTGIPLACTGLTAASVTAALSVFGQLSPRRVAIIAAGNRTASICMDERTASVPRERRSISIACDNRYAIVPAEQRTAKETTHHDRT